MKPLPRDLGALVAGGKAALARALSALEETPDAYALSISWNGAPGTGRYAPKR